MQHFRFVGFLVAAPALAALLSIAGCSGDKSEQPAAKKSDVGAEGKGVKKSGGRAEKEPLAAKSWGSLKGKVTYDGEPEPVKNIPIPDSVKEKDQCLQGDTRVQTWKIGPDKGVGNVMVWLRAPKGKYFQIPADEQKADPSVVKLDQPHCSFIPHVFVLYPSFYDAATKKQKSTGQVFEVVNSAPFNHNTNWSASDQTLIAGGNVIIPAKTGTQKVEVKASRDRDAGGEQQLKFSCNIHTWMNAFARAFDHPYATVTTGDEKDAKEYGTYEIKKIPAGVEVELVAWHPSFKEPKVIKTITFKEGENTEIIKIKADEATSVASAR
jgi:hypothetical protein